MLAETPGVGPRAFRRLLDAFASPRGVLEADEAALARTPRIGPKLAAAIRAVQRAEAEAAAAAQRDLELAARHAARLVTLRDADYPVHLRSLPDAPPLLWCIGDPACCRGPALAVVGSRNATEYGRAWTTAACRELASRGWTIVSGMAAGIDSCAHRAALDVGGATVGVAGCGVAALPRETATATALLRERGVILSEFAPLRPAVPGSFPKRNRTICGLALGTLVVEAAERSGALITARYALQAGRPVFALPGRAGDPNSRGVNGLIKQGARLVESAGEIAAVFHDVVAKEPKSSMLTPQGAAPCRETSPVAPPRAGLEGLVWRLLAQGSRDIDELLAATGAAPAEMAVAVLRLELEGAVERLPGNRLGLRR